MGMSVCQRNALVAVGESVVTQRVLGRRLGMDDRMAGIMLNALMRRGLLTPLEGGGIARYRLTEKGRRRLHGFGIAA
jgi:hypothetical protein